MTTVTTIVQDELRARSAATGVAAEVGPGAVSWPAIFAGATAAAALSLILLVLGIGLGLSSVSPWTGAGASVEAMSWSTIAWICFMALAASGLGGYLAGRLRTRWAYAQRDEVHFRDTAHGFLAWAVGTLFTAALLTSAIGAILGTTAQAITSPAAAQGIEEAADTAGGDATDAARYWIDSLFRGNATAAVMPGAPTAPAQQGMQGNSVVNGADSRGEVQRIFDRGMQGGALSAEDARYAGQVIAQQTGISQQEAEQRVQSTWSSARTERQEAETKARQAADEARKNGAYASLWIFVSLLLGAFFASLMATYGGRRRDLP